MDPSRKRIVRLTVALSAAVLLAVALAYTSFSASSQATTPKQLVANAEIGKSYEVSGRVEKGSYQHNGSVHEFRVAERTGGASVPVRYEGTVPDPFREGREVIVTVRKRQDGTFEGTKVVTKCPSKFTTET
ncbi:MAG TPA: cytochrome c maturation protein CcmE [Solirubrobacteraceae bacterium]|jgi:cytochrome c-type biogenesis protein CcmE